MEILLPTITEIRAAIGRLKQNKVQIKSQRSSYVMETASLITFINYFKNIVLHDNSHTIYKKGAKPDGTIRRG